VFTAIKMIKGMDLYRRCGLVV